MQRMTAPDQNNVKMRSVLPIFKEFALMGHFLKQMCQQHFQPRFGATVDNFLQIKNSRRVIPLGRVIERSAKDKVLWKLVQSNKGTNLEVTISAAILDNSNIDQFYTQKESQELCLIDRKYFPCLNGAAFKSPAVAPKPGASSCTDYHIKDRKNGDLNESSNLSLGVETHR